MTFAQRVKDICDRGDLNHDIAIRLAEEIDGIQRLADQAQHGRADAENVLRSITWVAWNDIELN